MNYDLAIMALEGMSRSPMRVETSGEGVVIEGDQASFKELARLCLLLGGVQTAEDSFDLAPGTHLTGESERLRLRLRTE